MFKGKIIKATDLDGLTKLVVDLWIWGKNEKWKRGGGSSHPNFLTFKKSNPKEMLGSLARTRWVTNIHIIGFCHTKKHL